MATLKGKWLFNETLVVTFTSEPLGGSIEFTCNGVEYDGVFLEQYVNDSERTIYYIRYYQIFGRSDYVYYGPNYSNRDFTGWKDYESRIVDFGDTPQEVEDDFYTWFIANAKPLVSGTWVFNKIVKNNGINQNINFTSIGVNYTKINQLNYPNSSTTTHSLGNLNYNTTNVYAGQTDTWVNKRYRIITFTEEQAVELNFYEWFISNAKLKVTDLTNTTWYVPSGWDNSPYHLSTWFINGTIGKYTGTSIVSTVFDSLENSKIDGITVYLDGSIGTRIPHSTVYFTISIVDGDSVKDNSLIEFLSTYGTQLKVTDLTNTTWTVKAGWRAEAGWGIFKIEGTLNDQSLWMDDKGSIGIGWWNDGDWYKEEADCIGFFGNITTMNVYSDDAFTLSITGGDDATNTKLTSWLSEYGELQSSEEEQLTTLTIYYGKAGSYGDVRAVYDAPIGVNFAEFVYTDYNTNRDFSLTSNATGTYVLYKGEYLGGVPYRGPAIDSIYSDMIANDGNGIYYTSGVQPEQTSKFKFTRLYIGKEVASNGYFRLLKLTTEKPIEMQTFKLYNGDELVYEAEMPKGWSFYEFIGTQYDTTDGKMVIDKANMVQWVHSVEPVKIVSIENADGEAMTRTNIASGKFYYSYVIADTQTLTVINSNNTDETATFTMPEGYQFSDFVGSEYDTSNGLFEIVNGNIVWYNGQPLQNSSGGYAIPTVNAVGEWYYDGESASEQQSLSIIDGNTGITYSYELPIGTTFGEYARRFDLDEDIWSYQNVFYFDGYTITDGVGNTANDFVLAEGVWHFTSINLPTMQCITFRSIAIGDAKFPNPYNNNWRDFVNSEYNIENRFTIYTNNQIDYKGNRLYVDDYNVTPLIYNSDNYYARGIVYGPSTGGSN